MYDSLKELLEAFFAKKAADEPVVFISDDELAEIEELCLRDDEGELKLNHPMVSYQAALLGYWCEADWDERGGGFVFALETKKN